MSSGGQCRNYNMIELNQRVMNPNGLVRQQRDFLRNNHRFLSVIVEGHESARRDIPEDSNLISFFIYFRL